MKQFLVVVDMQKDFVDGSLGSKEAVAIVPAVVEKIRSFEGEVFVTYDTHFEGYEQARELAKKWSTLKGRVDDEIFENVSERFDRQLLNAREWCDQVNSYFFRKSGIPDEKGRQIW